MFPERQDQILLAKPNLSLEKSLNIKVLFIKIKIELLVTSLSDTPHLQYYDVQTLEYRYISKLIISPSKF